MVHYTNIYVYIYIYYGSHTHSHMHAHDYVNGEYMFSPSDNVYIVGLCGWGVPCHAAKEGER